MGKMFMNFIPYHFHHQMFSNKIQPQPSCPPKALCIDFFGRPCTTTALFHTTFTVSGPGIITCTLTSQLETLVTSIATVGHARWEFFLCSKCDLCNVQKWMNLWLLMKEKLQMKDLWERNQEDVDIWILKKIGLLSHLTLHLPNYLDAAVSFPTRT